MLLLRRTSGPWQSLLLVLKSDDVLLETVVRPLLLALAFGSGLTERHESLAPLIT